MKALKIPNKFFFKSKFSNLVIYYATRYKDSYFVSCSGAPAHKWSREELESKILNGDFIICQSEYKWQSLTTGEVVKNFWEVLETVWVCLTKCRFLNIKWKYNKNGF